MCRELVRRRRVRSEKPRPSPVRWDPIHRGPVHWDSLRPSQARSQPARRVLPARVARRSCLPSVRRSCLPSVRPSRRRSEHPLRLPSVRRPRRRSCLPSVRPSRRRSEHSLRRPSEHPWVRPSRLPSEHSWVRSSRLPSVQLATTVLVDTPTTPGRRDSKASCRPIAPAAESRTQTRANSPASRASRSIASKQDQAFRHTRQAASVV